MIAAFLFSKKAQYLVYSALATFSLILLVNVIQTQQVLFLVCGGLIFSAVILFIFAQFLVKNIGLTHLAFMFLLPIHMFVGMLLVFFYFPNLGLIVQIAGFLSVGAITYLLFLINNIFFVIEERGELIPLYAVAVTWVQILIIVICNAYFAGIYKIPVNYLLQNLFVLVSSFLLFSYMIWVVSYDTDIKKTTLAEKLYVALILAFMVFILAVSVSFFPTESFLRGLFVSSLVLGGLGYIQAHYKNRLTTRMLLEYGTISLVFLLILYFFHP